MMSSLNEDSGSGASWYVHDTKFKGGGNLAETRSRSLSPYGELASSNTPASRLSGSLMISSKYRNCLGFSVGSMRVFSLSALLMMSRRPSFSDQTRVKSVSETL